MKAPVLVLALIFSVPLIAQTHTPTQSFEPQSATTSAAPLSAEDKQQLKSDLDHMKVLVQQMQKNLAFVTNGETPLKHEFELEIEMWQIMIRQMETRLGPTQNTQR